MKEVILNHAKAITSQLALWFAPALFFLLSYIGLYHYPLSAAFSHLYLVSLAFSIATLTHIILISFLGNKRYIHYLIAALYTSWLFCSIIYYIFVIIGLESWGKVITIELLTSYSLQASRFANTIVGINLSTLFLFLVAFYLLLFYISFRLTNWTTHKTSANLKPKKLTLTLLTSFLIFALSSIHFYFDDITYYAFKKEPLALTLQLGKALPKNTAANIRQGIAVDSQIDRKEIKVRESYRTAPSAIKRNVILIVADALRPDHMGVYGYYRETTPFLNQLRDERKLTTFQGTRSSCNESSCGLLSLASSRFIHTMPQEPFTIQQVLKTYGYKINLILGGDHTNFYSLKSLYGEVDYYFDGSMVSDKYYLNDDRLVLDQIDLLQNWDSHPTFMQFHLMSSHVLGLRWPQNIKYLPQAYYGGKPKTIGQEYINFYDNGVLQTDSVINQIIQKLQMKGYLNNAIVIITADHGESLGEHKKWSHTNSVYEQQLRIPFLWINYNDDSSTHDSHNNPSQVDIAPMILCSLNMHPPENWDGYACDQKKKRDYNFFASKPFAGLIDTSNSNHQWKYWKNHLSDEEYAYDLSNDPSETNNMINTIPTSLLDSWRSKLKGIKFE